MFPFFTIGHDCEQTGFVAIGCILTASRAAVGPGILRDATMAQDDIQKIYWVDNHLFVIDEGDFDTPVLTTRQLGHHLNVASLFLEIGVGVFQPQNVGSVHFQFYAHFDIRRLEMDTNVCGILGFQFLKNLKWLLVVSYIFVRDVTPVLDFGGRSMGQGRKCGQYDQRKRNYFGKHFSWVLKI
jgi:hypothetical protein